MLLIDAALAHPVERHLAKVEVASSSLVSRSKSPLLMQWAVSLCAGMMELADMRDLGSRAVRRSLLRSASPVCVRAGKAPHPQSPSSFPKRESRGGLPFRFKRGRSMLHSVSAVSIRAAKTAHPLRPSSFPKRESHGGLPFRFKRRSRGGLRFGLTRGLTWGSGLV